MQYTFHLFQYMCHRRGAERALSVTANAQNVTVGEARIHPHITPIAGDASTTIHVRNEQVTEILLAPLNRNHFYHPRKRSVENNKSVGDSPARS